MSTFELPLSWSHGGADGLVDWRALALETGGQFIHAPQVGPGATLESLKERLDTLAKQAPLVAQGLDAEQLQALGAESGAVLIGSSARITLGGYRPPHKVRNLARRASEAAAAEVKPAASGPLQDELELAARGGQATLRYVFRARVEDADRAFVVSAAGRAVGLVSLTQTGGGAWHVELLVRHPEAPDGAMELLLSHVVEVLQREAQARLDLGQVAFFVEEPAREGLGALNRALLAAVPAAVAATGSRFNFEGLRRFKNKFDVQWVPRYFAGWPRLRRRDFRAACDAADLGQFLRLGW
ncbi:MAG: phosphatidylglycerol lysyltransferase domain-containing protein [Archangium sp.]|nr:phosphatidylglycerol lysyltransferase domain-containing protein [Archangium sp.]